MIGTIIVILIIGGFYFWKVYILQSSKHGAPFIPTSQETLKKAIDMANIQKDEIFYDLGSGDGQVVIAAALKGARAYGIEIDQMRVWYSRFWIKLLRLGKNAHIIHDNLLDINLAEANIVFLYLLPTINNLLEQKLDKELKSGSRVIAIGFPIPNWTPIDFDIGGPIYLYIKN